MSNTFILAAMELGMRLNILFSGLLAIVMAFAMTGQSRAESFQTAGIGEGFDVTVARGGGGGFWGGNTTRRTVRYETNYAPGTIVISTEERKLYLVQENGRAVSYSVGVGRPGFQWGGNMRISRKAEWPGWTPPPAMRRRQPYLPAYVPGGVNNPLGARALYLGSSLYRIHGTTEAQTIGTAVSSGCIRMMNKDVEDLYDRVPVGTRVIVQR
jgi:lipoprotein-anchoring transpeptidase ErfK/SrfK